MSGALVSLVAKHVLKDYSQKNTNIIDPLHDYTDILDRNGRPTGKKRKTKKGPPANVSTKDAAILQSVRRRAYKLDLSLFSLCGIRFGWSSVIGIIPVIGDVVDMLVCYLLIIRKCNQIEGGLPASLRTRMMLNMMLDFGIGLVPFAGDLADAMFKANSKNAWLLEDYLVKKAVILEADKKKDPEPARRAGLLDIFQEYRRSKSKTAATPAGQSRVVEEV